MFKYLQYNFLGCNSGSFFHNRNAGFLKVKCKLNQKKGVGQSINL